MSVEIKFEIEGETERSGIVAENSYLWDAAKRLGVPLETEAETSDDPNALDDCVVTVKKGAEHLSTPTSAEMQHLTDEQRNNGERLARQARIQSSGEIIVMVKKKAAEKTEAQKEREWREEFRELPFEKRFATLVELEAVVLGDTLGYVANLPYTITGKVVDILASFGWEIDKTARKSRRPEEHQPEQKDETEGKQDSTEGETNSAESESNSAENQPEINAESDSEVKSEPKSE